jgi:uncharacterized membrane-anchored protein YitT (DUF2179 family)
MNNWSSQTTGSTGVQGSSRRREHDAHHEYTKQQIERGFKELRRSLFGMFKESLFLVLGIMSAAFGLEAFLLPNDFIDGGVTGISLLISEKTGVDLALLIAIINIPFVLLGTRVVGRAFAIKTAIVITGLSLAVAFIHFPEVTNDKLLVAVFGGFFLGAGIGLSIRGGAVLDGTEVLAIFLSKKLHSSIGDFIIVFNIIIFSVAAYLLSLEQALYSMITYLAASKTLDFVVEGIEEYIGVTIISMRSEEVRQMVIQQLGRGVTIYKGKAGYGRRGDTREVDIIFTVITRLEVSKLNQELHKLDPSAFVFTSSIKDTQGGMIKRRPLH